ncbi:MAG: zinc ABC transporter substrate-binding protein [Gammaproteobacteria bacterium]|nr:zinc ABC transporter substrate-binding protein [Gammaproteobacteria bacterium]
MYRIIPFLLLLAVSLPSRAELRLFACEPEWEALAKEIGRDRVDTYSATTALQDPHYIQARPGLIAKIRGADLVVCSGAQLEIGWLPVLLQKGNNPKVQPGAPGFFEASGFVRRLEVPASVDRAQGDIHPQGNPHVQTNPHNINRIAMALAERMAQLDAANADAYRAGLDDFQKRWDAAISGWESRAAPLKGKRVITHHKSWAYLEDWLGLKEVGNLEPIPGLPPTTSHLSELLGQFGQGGADFIIRAPFQDHKPSGWLSGRSGIPALVLPLTVGGSDRATNLFTLFDDTLDRLLGMQP